MNYNAPYQPSQQPSQQQQQRGGGQQGYTTPNQQTFYGNASTSSSASTTQYNAPNSAPSYRPATTSAQPAALNQSEGGYANYNQNSYPNDAKQSSSSWQYSANAPPPQSSTASGSSSSPDPYGQIFQQMQSNPAAQVGLQISGQAFNAGQAYMNQNVPLHPTLMLSRWIDLPHLKFYFKVNNSYVTHKLSLILFPWRHRNWARSVLSADQNQQTSSMAKPPRDDINAPDLYIPLTVMAMVTYVLLVGWVSGQNRKFTPEVLGITATSSIALTVVEVILIKIGCYLLNVGSGVAMSELVAVTGYKFVSVIFCQLLKQFLYSWTLWISMSYIFMAAFFFMIRTWRQSLVPDTSQLTNTFGGGTQKSQRVYFLFLIVVIQILASWLLIW